MKKKIKNLKLAVIGLGYVGLPLALEFSKKKKVIGFDINNTRINELKIERRFFDRFNNIAGGVNVINGIIKGGKDDGVPLFKERSYVLND